MRRLLGGLLLASAVVVAGLAAPAGADAAPPVAGTDVVSAPLVGFDPLFAPWWVRHAGRTTGPSRTTTVLYLADGSTPEAGRGFAMTRGHAVDGADACGAPLPPLGIRRGPFRGAEAVQVGTTTVVRRVGVRAGVRQAVLVTRDMTVAEVRALAEQARVVRSAVLAPKTVPHDVTLSGLAPIDTMLTGGPGTDFRLVYGTEPERLVRVHGFTTSGPAQDAERFFRTTSVPMACTPNRYVVTTVGDAVVTTVSSVDDDAARVSAMVEPVTRAQLASNLSWARRPSVTQFARRCAGSGVLMTLAGDNHGRLWGVGFRADRGAPICVAGTTGGQHVPPARIGTRGVVVSLERSETCGVSLVAGWAPARTRRVVIRTGRSHAQQGHLRTVRAFADRPPQGTVWAALVRTAPTTAPAFTVTAFDERGKQIDRATPTPGPGRRCRAGQPTTSTTGATTSTSSAATATSTRP